MTEPCYACRDDMHFICEWPIDEGDCCCPKITVELPEVIEAPSEPPKNLSQLLQEAATQARSVGRPRMDPADMKNNIQAGRKRAEDMLPLSSDYICDWTLLRYAGGGIDPIVGCAGNIAAHRHHGPDKSTMNNDPGVNIHRVCNECHNRWHVRNDNFYGERPTDGSAYLPLSEHGECKPHDRFTRVEPRDVIAHDLWWKQPIDNRSPYRSWEHAKSV